MLIAVPGSGKSTIMNLVKKRIPELKTVIFGDVMFEIAKKKFGIKNRDEMRKKIKLKDYRRLQELAAERIGRLKGKVIIDTHASIKQPLGYYPGLPSHIIKKIRPDSIVLLEFDPKVIFKRRMIDLKLKKPERTSVGTVREPRSRDIESEEEIELHQTMNRMFAVAAANEVACPVKIINLRFKEKREFEHAEKAAEEIVKMLKG